MTMSIKKVAKRLMANAGVALTRADHLSELERSGIELLRVNSALAIVAALNSSDGASVAEKLRTVLTQSRSQLLQDGFALAALGFIQGGYFVEFGAADGLRLSNSLLLEKQFGWKGILSEPARCWHKMLNSARSATVDHRCVWSKSGETLTFLETESAELSTLRDFAASDSQVLQRNRATHYPVETVSLNDLLSQHGAPATIDYLSIDTEGSEFEILSELDFSRWRFSVISCEHNYTASREKIYHLLRMNGYRRVLADVSLFDDWYVHASIGSRFRGDDAIV